MNLNIFALVSLLASFIDIMLANFIYYTNPKNSLNRVIAVLTIFVGFLAFVEFTYRQAGTLETAYFWLKVSLLWPIVPALMINVALIFGAKFKFLKKRMTYVLIYLPALLIIFLSLTTDMMFGAPVLEYYGWTYTISAGFLFGILGLWSILAGLVSALIFFSYYIGSEDPLEKKQAEYIFIGLYLPLVLSLVTDIIIPIFWFRIPEMTMLFITVGIAFIAYGTWKYQFPMLTPTMAAEKIITTMYNFLILLDHRMRIVNINNSGLKLLGYSQDEVYNLPLNFLLEDAKALELISKTQNKSNQNKSLVHTMETSLKSIDGTFVPVLISVSTIRIREDQPPGLVCIGNDLIQEKKMKKALYESEEMYKTLLKTDPDSVVTTDLEGNIIHVSEQTTHMHGYSMDELEGKSVFDLIAPECQDKALRTLIKTIERGMSRNNEVTLLKKDGSRFTGEINAATIRDLQGENVNVMYTIRDITHHKQAEAQIQASLDEKEVLLREIHHRVKNNLQIISSLLNLQSSYLKDKASREVLNESKDRVKSMAMIHQKLYQSGNFEQIEMGEYVEYLVKGLFNSYGVDSDKVKLKTDLQKIYLDIDTAIPLGLVINEIITNSIKHAFPGELKGEIFIKIFQEGENYLIVVADNGVGLPEDLDVKKTASLGMQLVNNLVRQIDGELELKRTKGTEFRIKFTNG
jgi:PAS domain S-box-containing protein